MTEVGTERCASIHAIVGIWEYEANKNVYMLRKHPGLEWLTPEERNLREDDLEEEGEEN